MDQPGKRGPDVGDASSVDGPRWARVAFWVFVTLFTFAGLDYPFGNGDEVRHAQTLKEMMTSSDFLTMRWQGVPSFTRPATQYWLAAIGASLIDGEAGMRVSSALASLVILILVAAEARRAFGRFDVTLVAVLLCAGAASYRDYSRSVMSEPFLVVALMLALIGTIRAQHDPRGLRLALASLGGAVAIKSLGAAPAAVLLLPWLIRAYRRTGGRQHALTGLGIALALGLPFYAIGLALHGLDFVDEHFGFNLMGRALGTINISEYPWHLYLWHFQHRDGWPTLLWLALGTIGALAVAFKKRDVNLAIIASFALGDVVLMSMMGTRLPHYVLVVYPAAALGAAGVYHHLSARAPHGSGVLRAIAPAAAAFLLITNLRMRGADDALMQTSAAKDLGLAVRGLADPKQRVYAYEWYGQGLSFYAERDVVLLTEVPERFRMIDVGHFKRAGAAKLVPPPPEPTGSRILVAARKPDLDRATWLSVEEPLAYTKGENVYLVRARIIDPQP
jgi:4-amino-4-deoxy-L-arabinose transferase-like glycosyltransferase